MATQKPHKTEPWKSLNSTRKAFRVAEFAPFVVGIFVMTQSYLIPDFLIRFSAGILIMLLTIPIGFIDRFLASKKKVE